MLFGAFFIDWRGGRFNRADIDVRSIVDKVLQNIPFVLHQDLELGLLDHFTQVMYQDLSFSGEL